LQSYLLYLICRLFLGLMRFLPRRAGLLLADSLACLAYYLDFRHRHIVRVNLIIAFPELSRREHARIGRQSFRNVARNALELGRFPLLSPENISTLVQYDPEFGLANYLAAKKKGKGILYITGHFSAWELLPAAHALYGHPLHFITRPLDNAPLESYLLQLREKFGNKVLSKKDSARRVLEAIKAREGVGILMDHNTTLQEGTFATLFGLPAATTTSVALFALRTGAAVLPGYMTPLRNGRYTVKFLPDIDLIRTGDMTRDVQLNTELFNQVMEGIIREQPEAWLWGHKRWKNQPEGNPDLYGLSREDLLKFLGEARSGKNTSSQISRIT
jgi:KDO2-lipid IV(A) lauroyltransferase